MNKIPHTWLDACRWGAADDMNASTPAFVRSAVTHTSMESDVSFKAVTGLAFHREVVSIFVCFNNTFAG